MEVTITVPILQEEMNLGLIISLWSEFFCTVLADQSWFSIFRDFVMIACAAMRAFEINPLRPSGIWDDHRPAICTSCTLKVCNGEQIQSQKVPISRPDVGKVFSSRKLTTTNHIPCLHLIAAKRADSSFFV